MVNVMGLLPMTLMVLKEMAKVSKGLCIKDK